ncbi:protein kinase domain-containing protein [Bacillus sp. SCS-153A]|uniref:protein kinase domain-containing protein n=1 Tax=Rossellomorea sedimentorum TaxID=3115294 RepID=UPI00390675AC
MEYFVTLLCRQHKLIPTEQKAPPVAQMIELVFQNGLINKKDRGLLHAIKDFGNGEAHVQFRSESGETRKRATVDKAVYNLKYLFYVLERYAGKHNLSLPQKEFNRDSLPILDVQPADTIKLNPNEACENKWYGTITDSQTNLSMTCIIREFRKDNFDKGEHFKIRDMLAIKRRWMAEPSPMNIVNYHPVVVEEENDYFYTCYKVNKNTKTLLDINVGELSNLERLEILLGIAEGIKQLHIGEDPIFHRFLRPESIFIHKDYNGKYVSKIGNFEFAKLYDPSGATVVSRVLSVDDVYSAPDIKSTRNTQQDWHTYDLYSFGVLILYVFAAKSLKVPIAQIKHLKKEGLSEEMQRMTKDLINPNPQRRPSVETVIETIGKEKMQYA